MTLEILQARQKSLEARIALDGEIEDASEHERAAMEADKSELELVKAEIEKLQSKGDDLEEVKKRYLELGSKVSLHSYLTSFARGKHLAHGTPEHELNTELGLSLEESIPFEALVPAIEEDKEKPFERADATTNLSSGDYGVVSHPLLGRIFAGSEADFLGVTFPEAGSGTYQLPTLTDGAAGAMKAQSAASDTEQFTISTLDLNPTRASAGYRFDTESVLFFGETLEDTLRADLRSVVQSLMDNQVMNGDGSSPNVNGLLNRLTDPSNPSGESDFAGYVSEISGGIDGKTATTEGDLRLLVGPDTWKHARSKYRTNNSEVDAIQAMRALGAGVRVSSRIPAVAAKRQDAIRVATASAGSLVAPVWRIDVVRDPYTGANKAELILRIHLFFSFGARRLDGLKQVRFQVQA